MHDRTRNQLREERHEQHIAEKVRLIACLVNVREIGDLLNVKKDIANGSTISRLAISMPSADPTFSTKKPAYLKYASNPTLKHNPAQSSARDRSANNRLPQTKLKTILPNKVRRAASQ